LAWWLLYGYPSRGEFCGLRLVRGIGLYRKARQFESSALPDVCIHPAAVPSRIHLLLTRKTEMNKTLLSTALVAVVAAIGFAPTAQAAGGTITISGKVLSDTCVVAVNGGSTVALPTVMTADLNTVGAVAGAINFTVGLTGCDTNTASATMAFSGANINANGNLDNTAVSGSNVQVQLLSGASVIDTSDNTNAPVISVANGIGSTTMTAQYVAATAAATPGLVSSSVDFTLTYL
jgi:major type 1 subunit fimbrin (pilin)